MARKQKARHNMARIAARAALNPTVGVRDRSRSVGMDPSLRIDPVAPRPGSTRNRKAARGTAAQRDSRGRRSDWAKSPYFATAATVDVRWSA